MENQSLFGDARPNCIILDEIDGAEGKAAIEALLAIITAPLPQHSNSSSIGAKNGTGSGGRRGGSAHALTRPLIVICNNQYAPHLRALRQVATVFAFRRTTPQRLAQRLKVICAAERIGARYVVHIHIHIHIYMHILRL
jgi:chromosome transmission fidelity protein 18